MATFWDKIAADSDAMKKGKKVLPWLRREAWTRSGWYWWITEDKALHPEYLDWPSANIVGLNNNFYRQQVLNVGK